SFGLGSPSFFCMALAALSSHFFRPFSLGGSLSSSPCLATFFLSPSALGSPPLASPCLATSCLVPPALPAPGLPPFFCSPPLLSATCSPCLPSFLSGCCDGFGADLVEAFRASSRRSSSFFRASAAAWRASPSCV